MFQNTSPQEHCKNEPNWLWSRNRTYTVASCYKIIIYRVRNSITETIGKIRAPNKVKAFLWLLVRKSILTLDNLQRRGWIGPGRCTLCQNEDSINHLFRECTFLIQVLSRIKVEFRNEKWENGNGEIKNLWEQYKKNK